MLDARFVKKLCQTLAIGRRAMPEIIKISRTGTGADLVDFVSVGMSPTEIINFTHNYSNSNPDTLVVAWHSDKYPLIVAADYTLSIPQLKWSLLGVKLHHLTIENYNKTVHTACLELYTSLNEIVRDFNKYSDREPVDVYQSLKIAMEEFMGLLAIEGKNN